MFIGVYRRRVVVGCPSLLLNVGDYGDTHEFSPTPLSLAATVVHFAVPVFG